MVSDPDIADNDNDQVPHCGETVAARTFRLLFYNESWIVSASDRDEDLENTSVMEVDRYTEL